MVHPSELLRTNSNEDRTFSAPRVQYQSYELDCGLTNIPILNQCCNLERFAKPKLFLVFLSLVGFLQGVTLTYFRETARIWGKHYNIAPDNIDWIIYINEFIVGIFALVVAYYGNRIHRISWIGGLTIFLSISSAILLVPEVYRKNYDEQANLTEVYLCGTKPDPVKDHEINYIALVVLAIFEVFYAIASVSFISHGMSYLDDNTSLKAAPGYIGIALACRELGKQAGLYFSWIPTYIHINAVFMSPIWLSIASVAFICGVLIAMFPQSMPSTLVRTLSASLVDLASGHEIRRPKPKVDGFFKTVFRLLKNKILMVNIFYAVFLQSGIINFNIFEKYFNQSRFQVSQVNDTSYTQFTTNILKQPLVAISLIAAGFLAAKTKPHLKSLVKWNITAIILVIIFFGSTAFLKCEPNTKYDEMMAKNHYNDKCNCSLSEFQPVCVKDKTYYSPCFAGCTEVKEDSFRKTYIKCLNGETANEGPCDEAKCNLFYTLSQTNRVFTTALIASTLVTNLIINMRCILSRDKATALGLELTFTALVAYLPVKAIYGVIAESYCVSREKHSEVCRLYSKNFATVLSLCTIGLMVLSLLLALIVLIFLKLKPVEEDDDIDEEIEMREPVRSRDEPDLAPNQKSGSTNSISDSLLEMENVGDDHDSIDSASHLDEPPIHRNRVIESDF